MNKKPIIFMLLLVVVGIVVGGTIAYFSSSDTFENEFNTGTYVIQTQENFESPDNWTPGTTTPKTVIATNKGNTPAAVRVKLTPSWVGSDGVTTLPLTDGTNEAAIINFSANSNIKWTKDGDWYYYANPLNTNDSTTSLIESVTFNPNVNISATHNCVENETTHETTCTTETTGYGDATYKLRVDIETCQFDKYKEIWNTTIKIKEPVDYLKVQANGYSNIFGKNISKYDFESIHIVPNKNIPDDVIDSWDASEAQNGSVMAWYTDSDNNEMYELYIGQEGGVYANPNSSYAFSGFYRVNYLDVEYLDTSDVLNMDSMFYNTGYPGGRVPEFTIHGLENWDTRKVENMRMMFQYTGRSATNWSIGDISNWNTGNVKNMHRMFYYSGYNATEFNIGNIGGWNVSSVEDMSDLFTAAGYTSESFYIGTLNNWDTRNVSNMQGVFMDCGHSVTNWDIGTLNIYADDISYGFSSIHYAKMTLNIHNKPTIYTKCLGGSALESNSSIVVNYTSTTTNIDAIIATKSSNSNVVKGVQLD